jgi:hypothetical protein
MTIKAGADNRFGTDSSEGYDHNLSRARIAGYVLLAGLLLEVVASLIWFHGVETLASIIAIALVASGVAGEIFFEGRARRANKAIVAALPSTKVHQCEPSRDATQSSLVTRPNNFKPLLQFPNRERRKLPGRRGRDGHVTEYEKDAMEKLGGVDLALVGLSADILNVPTEQQALEHVRLYQPDVFMPAHHDGALQGHMPLWRATEPVFQALKDADPGLVTVSRGYREPVCFDTEINIRNDRKR